MAQFLRPNANITQTGFTGGFAEIDEATASDADFAYGANGGANVLEVGLTDPAGTPGAGTSTVRYRVAKVNGGALSGNGNAVTVTAEVYQGTTLIAADAARTATGTWAAYSWTPDLSGVTDWADLRLRFTDSANGGSPSGRRAGAVSWAEVEAPDDAAPTLVATLSQSFGAAALVATAAVGLAAALSQPFGATTLSGAATSAIAAEASGSFGAMTLTATSGAEARTASFVQAFGALALGGTVSVPLAAAINRTLGSAVLDGAITTGSEPSFSRSPRWHRQQFLRWEPASPLRWM